MEATLDGLQMFVAEESPSAICGWLTEERCTGPISCWSSTYAAPTDQPAAVRNPVV
ncbi:hypothetical protein AB0M29_40280 [Streptomyces sp. NPDC051976]|uniref:hypothetical protein n=1 Tax=Streptomyces sp. NPDC051976 TaxID=3154947 RepID=UPI003448FE17